MELRSDEKANAVGGGRGAPCALRHGGSSESWAAAAPATAAWERGECAIGSHILGCSYLSLCSSLDREEVFAGCGGDSPHHRESAVALWFLIQRNS